MSSVVLEQAAVLRSLRTNNRNIDRAMREHWDMLHATGHVALLATMGDRERYKEMTEHLPEARSIFSWGLGSTGINAFLLKGAWAVGRLGKLMLPAYKKALSEDVSLYDLFDTLFALIAIGRRNKGLRAEIAKALRAAHLNAGNPQAQQLRQDGNLVRSVCAAAESVLLDEDEDRVRRTVLAADRRLLDDAIEDVLEEDRDEVCSLLVVTMYADGISSGDDLLRSMALISFTARSGPEQFYLPKRWVDVMVPPWEPSFTRRILAPVAQAERAAHRPVTRRAVPGPNEPCSCGSGTKYKKCCGRVGG